MKYLADDNSVFNSEQECLQYEQDCQRDAVLDEQLKHFLSLQEWEGTEASVKRERTKASNWITKWLRYDARQRPERYADVNSAHDKPAELKRIS